MTRVSGYCEFVKTACYCCIVAILIMTCVLLYQVYFFLNCMGCDVILSLKIIRLSEGIVFIFPIVRLFFLS